MKKEYDITKLYVALIGRQGKVKYTHYNAFDADASWKYTNFKAMILVKTPFGFKHFLTGEYYKKATHKTSEQYVIAYNCVHKIAKYDPDLIEFYIKREKTLKIKAQEKGSLDIVSLEKYFNQPRQHLKLMRPFLSSQGVREFEEYLEKTE